MVRKVIMWDVDGVLADFVLGFTTLANAMFDTKIVTTGEQPSWNFRTWGLMTREQENEVWDVLKETPGWWASLQPLVSDVVLAEIDALQHLNEVVFVTSRFSHKGPPGQQTKLWLSDHGIYNASVIVSSKKGEVAKAIGAHFSIDDKLQNACCVHWLTEGKTKSFLIDRPYNQVPAQPEIASSSIIRVPSVTDYLDQMEQMSREMK